jgi:hypothetical protein
MNDKKTKIRQRAWASQSGPPVFYGQPMVEFPYQNYILEFLQYSSLNFLLHFALLIQRDLTMQ